MVVTNTNQRVAQVEIKGTKTYKAIKVWRKVVDQNVLMTVEKRVYFAPPPPNILENARSPDRKLFSTGDLAVNRSILREELRSDIYMRYIRNEILSNFL